MEEGKEKSGPPVRDELRDLILEIRVLTTLLEKLWQVMAVDNEG